MFETMYAAGGVGLAANQIGVDLRVFVFDCPDEDNVWHAGVVVNPVLETSEIPATADPEEDPMYRSRLRARPAAHTALVARHSGPGGCVSTAGAV